MFQAEVHVCGEVTVMKSKCLFLNRPSWWGLCSSFLKQLSGEYRGRPPSLSSCIFNFQCVCSIYVYYTYTSWHLYMQMFNPNFSLGLFLWHCESLLKSALKSLQSVVTNPALLVPTGSVNRRSSGNYPSPTTTNCPMMTSPSLFSAWSPSSSSLCSVRSAATTRLQPSTNWPSFDQRSSFHHCLNSKFRFVTDLLSSQFSVALAHLKIQTSWSTRAVLVSGVFHWVKTSMGFYLFIALCTVFAKIWGTGNSPK